MQIQITVDDKLFTRAIEVTGLQNFQLLIEAVLESLIRCQPITQDMAGRLNCYAKPGMIFSQERTIAWSSK